MTFSFSAVAMPRPRYSRLTPVSSWLRRPSSVSIRCTLLIPNYVGMSNVHRIDTELGLLNQDDTGVRREYRGRGIATALKLKVINFGKKNGYRTLRTWNDSSNAPMLAVNTKLGFKRQVGWVMMEKILGSESGA